MSTLAELDLTEEFHQQFNLLVAEQTTKSGIAPTEWRSGGRRSKAYPDKENVAWWLEHGPSMVKRYAEWREQIAALGWQLWIAPGGEPAVELELLANFGAVAMKMFIDRVFVSPEGELVVVDLKSGSRKPESNLQLGIYACGLELTLGVRPSWGAYYMTRDAALTDIVPLDVYTVAQITSELELFSRAIDNEIFIPNRGSHCKNCGVAKACSAVGGPEAHLFDPLSINYIGRQEL